MDLQGRNVVDMTLDPQVDHFRRKAWHHITALQHRFHHMVPRQLWDMADMRITVIKLQLAWSSMVLMELQQQVVMVRLQLLLKERMPLMGTARLAMGQLLFLLQDMPLEQNTTQATMITVLAHMTAGIKQLTHKITASRTVLPPITVRLKLKPTPPSSTMIGQLTLVTTHKPTRKAMQKPISTRMVVITRTEQEMVKK